jgi:hypothetical protein
MRPFAAGLVSEMLTLHPSIPYGTNNNGIFPNTFFQNFTVASRPCLVEPPEEPIPAGFRARIFSETDAPNPCSKRLAALEAFELLRDHRLRGAIGTLTYISEAKTMESFFPSIVLNQLGELLNEPPSKREFRST